MCAHCLSIHQIQTEMQKIICGLFFLHFQNLHPAAKLLVSKPERSDRFLHDSTAVMLVSVIILPVNNTAHYFSFSETMVDMKPHVETTTTKKVLIKTIETRDGQVESTSSDRQSIQSFSDGRLSSGSQLIPFSLSSSSSFR